MTNDDRDRLEQLALQVHRLRATSFGMAVVIAVSVASLTLHACKSDEAASRVLPRQVEMVSDGGRTVSPQVRANRFEIVSADSPMVSDNTVPVTSVEDARRVLRILEAIEDNDDVQDVFSNFDIADDVLEAAAQ
jgi:hypothetical protein